MTALFRIRTEATGEMGTRATALVAEVFDSFTATRGTGYWKGVAEESITFDVVTQNSYALECKITALAERIRAANNQHAVMIEMTELLGSKLVTA
jgi:hypothetical protein